jgi:putative transposase
LQYARWDLTQVELVDSHDNTLLCRIYPLDKSENASGKCRVLEQDSRQSDTTVKPVGVAPLLENRMADYVATGLPPAYIPKENLTPAAINKEENQ